MTGVRQQVPDEAVVSQDAFDASVSVSRRRKLRSFRVLGTVLDQVSAIASAVGALVIIALLLVVVMDVIRRNAGAGGVPGAIELGEALLPAAVFLGFGHAYQTGGHVAITFFTDKMSPALAAAFELVGSIATLLMLGWAAFLTSEAAWNSYSSGEFRFGLLNVPLWPARLSIALGFVLISLQVLKRIAQLLGQLATNRISEDQRSPS